MNEIVQKATEFLGNAANTAASRIMIIYLVVLSLVSVPFAADAYLQLKKIQDKVTIGEIAIGITIQRQADLERRIVGVEHDIGVLTTKSNDLDKRVFGIEINR